MAWMKAPPPSHYYPRIYRPAVHRIVQSPALPGTVNVLRMLLAGLKSIFEVVEPCPENAAAYGHRIRLQLIAVSTEVETGLSAVLDVNRYPGSKWTMRDYCKLKDPLQLDRYSVWLPYYPTFPGFQPFAAWGTTPMTPLPWYQAYNQAKHDRETNLPSATLSHTIHATGALLVVAVAQFGSDVVQFSGLPQDPVLGISNEPQLGADDYVEGPDIARTGWVETHYPF